MNLGTNCQSAAGLMIVAELWTAFMAKVPATETFAARNSRPETDLLAAAHTCAMCGTSGPDVEEHAP
jgi:hypothetical protein